MDPIARSIEAHEQDLAQHPGDRRAGLIELWKQFRRGSPAGPVIKLSLEVIEDGTVNEVELGFSMLMGLGLTDASLLSHLRALANHRSSKVRHRLAFHLSRALPEDFCAEVYRELLQDKAATVRARTIQSIGLRGFKPVLADLRALRSAEQNPKVIQALDFWIPLLETGYRVDPSPHPGKLNITALIRSGIASRLLETDDPSDARIPQLVAELRSLPF
jgi:hypothetical protein